MPVPRDQTTITGRGGGGSGGAGRVAFERDSGSRLSAGLSGASKATTSGTTPGTKKRLASIDVSPWQVPFMTQRFEAGADRRCIGQVVPSAAFIGQCAEAVADVEAGAWPWQDGSAALTRS